MSITPVSITKIKLANSLDILLATENFRSITIKKIVDQTGISRQAFYLHFNDKYDLMNWAFARRSDGVIENNMDKVPWSVVLARLMNFHKEFALYNKALLEYRGQNSLSEYMEDYTFNTYYRLLGKKYMLSEKELEKLEFQLKLYSCGSANMSVRWVFRGMLESPRQIATNLIQSMNADIKSYFS